jgi:hypothetical protein
LKLGAVLAYHGFFGIRLSAGVAIGHGDGRQQQAAQQSAARCGYACFHEGSPDFELCRHWDRTRSEIGRVTAFLRVSGA